MSVNYPSKITKITQSTHTYKKSPTFLSPNGQDSKATFAWTFFRGGRGALPTPSAKNKSTRGRAADVPSSSLIPPALSQRCLRDLLEHLPIAIGRTRKQFSRRCLRSLVSGMPLHWRDLPELRDRPPSLCTLGSLFEGLVQFFALPSGVDYCRCWESKLGDFF